MANKSLTFSDIEIRDDGTNLVFIAGGVEILSINKTTGIASSLTASDGAIGGITFSGGGNIEAGVTTYFNLDNVTDDLTIGGNPTFTNPVNLPQVNITNQTGAETCGTANTGISGNVTINTTAVASNSVILVTPVGHLPSTIIYVNNVIPGTSFEIITSDSGMDVNWLIINPI